MTLKKKKKHESDHLAVYRPTPFIQIVAFCVILFMLAVYVFSDGGIDNWMNKFEGGIFPILWGFFLLFMLWVLFMTIARDKLIVTEDGIIWWYFGFRKEATWDDLSHFTTRWWGKKMRRWGIELSNGNFLHLDLYLMKAMLLSEERYREIANFQQSDIGQHFYQYAPHLFDDTKSKKKKD